MLPKRCVDYKQCEVMRFYKLDNKGSVVPLSMTVPRKVCVRVCVCAHTCGKVVCVEGGRGGKVECVEGGRGWEGRVCGGRERWEGRVCGGREGVGR